MRFCVSCGLAGLLALGCPVLARELPPAKPLSRTGGCEWAGPGFIKAEGSDTCVRVNGSVRADFSRSAQKPAYLPGLPGN